MMGGGGMMGGWGFGGLGLIGGILNLVITLGVIVGIVLLVIWLIRRVGGEGGALTAGRRASPSSAREILQTRYVRGELTREQYQQMLSDLS
jgi:putative membrane protein